MALMEITVVPLGMSTSVSKYVAGAILALEGTPDLEYESTPMGTIVSGDVDDLLAAAKKMHQAVLEAGAQRVETLIRIDDRKDKPITLRSKLASLKKALEDKD